MAKDKLHPSEVEQIKRHCRGKVCFRLKDQEPGEFCTQEFPYDESLKEVLKRIHGDNLDVIYNEKFNIK